MTIVIIVQYRRGSQSALMNKMAVVILIAGAGLYYLDQVFWTMNASARASGGLALGQVNLLIIRISRVANVILDIAGLFAISRAKRKI